jgi:hypothetical protein
MKLTALYPKFFRRAFITAGALAAVISAQAGLQIPYTPDVSTLHLWHLDDPLLTNGVTNILVADAVTNASITLTNAGLPTPGTPPYSDTSLGNTSFPGLGTCMTTTDKNGFCYGGKFSDVSSFSDTNTGAFTFEAAVKFTGNVLALANNQEIICGDNTLGLSQRGWQFRIDEAGEVEFNLLGGSGSDNDWKAKLPTTGSDAAVANQWYHVAVTCTGNNPTNGNTPNILKFYWTLLDANRTYADLLATFTMTRALNGTTSSGSGTVQPAFGIGGSGRNYPAANANGEAVIGSVDEVRISSVARASNQMAFVTGGALNPPSFPLQPAANTLIGYGQTLSLAPLVSGSLPIYFQWQATNSSAGGWTNVPNQTNSTLIISNVTFPVTGSYWLVATNAYGSKTSIVAQVTVGAAFSELYDTGISTNGIIDTVNLPGNPDPHYTMVDSADASYPGPNALVYNMFANPIASYGGNFSNPDSASAWIGEQANFYASLFGNYVYRTKFLLDSVDTTQPASITGIVWVNQYCSDILINGVSTGNSNPASYSASGKYAAPFVISNGFVPGVNTLDFVTTLPSTAPGAILESAVRVELSGIGQALAPGKPQIVTEPAANDVVRDASVQSGGSATFSVVATGRPPLSYQWVDQQAGQLAGATNRTLTFLNPTAGGQGTNFVVVISNASGSVTSTVAKLTIVETNQVPIAPTHTYSVYSNNSIVIDMSELLQAASEPDNDPLTISWDGSTTNAGNGAAFVQNISGGTCFTYTPAPGFVGYDEFNYYIQDSVTGTQTTGQALIDVLPLTLPSMHAVQAGKNLVFSGSGGAPNGAYIVLSSTNLALPLSSWTTVTSGNFDGTGAFSANLPVNTNNTMQFYSLELP